MKKLISACFIIIFSTSLISCFNYNEINKITFVTAMIVDLDDNNNISLYLDCVTSYKNAKESQEKGKRIIFNGTGDTITEAIEKVKSECSNELNFSQINSYIFTEKCCSYGINKYLDIIRSNQEFAYKADMFCYFGDVKELLETKNIDEEYLGVYLEDLVSTNKNNANVLQSDVNKYISNSTEPGNISFMTKIEMEGKDKDAKIKINGALVMKDNKLVSTMNEEDVCIYKILSEKVTKGSLKVYKTKGSDEFITLDIMKNTINTNVILEDNKYTLNKKIKLKVSIKEVQGDLEIDNAYLENLKTESQKQINSEACKLYEKFYANNIDILHFERMIEKKYPKYDANKIQNSNLAIETVIDIESDGMIKDRF